MMLTLEDAKGFVLLLAEDADGLVDLGLPINARVWCFHVERGDGEDEEWFRTGRRLRLRPRASSGARAFFAPPRCRRAARSVRSAAASSLRPHHRPSLT